MPGSPTVYTLTVRVTDAGGLSGTCTVQVAITLVANEPPVRVEHEHVQPERREAVIARVRLLAPRVQVVDTLIPCKVR